MATFKTEQLMGMLGTIALALVALWLANNVVEIGNLVRPRGQQ